MIYFQTKFHMPNETGCQVLQSNGKVNFLNLRSPFHCINHSELILFTTRYNQKGCTFHVYLLFNQTLIVGMSILSKLKSHTQLSSMFNPFQSKWSFQWCSIWILQCQMITLVTVAYQEMNIRCWKSSVSFRIVCGHLIRA